MKRSRKKKTSRKQPNGRQTGKTGLDRISLDKIKPSPENDEVYSPISAEDPEIRALAESIESDGLLEPLVVSEDHWILSGHRRYAACKLAGLTIITVRIEPIRRSDDPDRFMVLLREYNRQREKTNSERLREELISINPDDAHAQLWKYRREQAAVNVQTIKTGHIRFRAEISAAKLPMLRAVQQIVENLKDFLPLSVRQIHYALLNDPPLTHANKPKSRYRNDQASYKNLVDLASRARLSGDIPFEAIGDETRPVQVWDVFQNPRAFVRRELKTMFQGYWRDLMQSQPNHIELVGEKNTVLPILRPVAGEFTIPLTIGRGFCSLPPRYAMAERFEKSGKNKLVLIIVSDFDPEGESIAESFARSMRDDFHIGEVLAVKAALTAEQAKQFDLPSNTQAKTTSSRYRGFAAKHGDAVHELEALDPEQLQQIVRQTIEAVIDRDALDHEIEAEGEDARFLAGVRRRVHEDLKGIDLEEESDEAE